MNTLLLEEVSKLSGSSMKELTEKLDAKYAKMTLGDDDHLQKILQEMKNPSSEKTIEDLLKELGEDF